MPASVVQCEWIMESFLYAIISSISVDSYLLHSISFFPFFIFQFFFRIGDFLLVLLNVNKYVFRLNDPVNSE